MAQTSRISLKSDQIILEVHQHHERMRLFNEGYQQLKSNKKAWKTELKERRELEGTLADGFENI